VISAYLIVFLDEHTKIVRAGIYSEPSPTTTDRVRPLVIAKVDGESYAIALSNMLEWLRGSRAIYDMCFPFKVPH